MAKNKKLQKALALSIVAMILCVAMLAGTTFAWFTDSATSSGNRIQAGNLDVDLLMWNGTKYASVANENGDIFQGFDEGENGTANNSSQTLWEPGKTQVVYLAIENYGNLDLLYTVSLNVKSEDDKKLYEVMQYAIDPNNVNMETESADDVESWATLQENEAVVVENVVLGKQVVSEETELTKGTTHYFALYVHMMETAGNEYQGGEIEFDLTVDARQMASEYDSFGNQYDVNSQYTPAATADDLIAALEAGEDVVLLNDIKIDPANMSNAYGTTGINVKKGQTINGDGHTLDIKGAGGTWDSGINTTGGLIKDLTVTGSFRGIFINHNSDYSEHVILENVIIDGTVYTISCDQGLNQGLTATNSTFNGWTSYAATLGDAKFVDCKFGEGSGYAFCRPYAPTTFENCIFEEGYEMDPRAKCTFKNCYIGDIPITAENLATLVTSNIANATVTK